MLDNSLSAGMWLMNGGRYTVKISCDTGRIREIQKGDMEVHMENGV